MNNADTRVDAITDWLRQMNIGSFSNIRPASADASFRRYFRVDDTLNKQTRIVMDAPPDKEDIAPFICITELLRNAGLHAPEILAEDRTQGFLLLSDLGNRTYLDHLTLDADNLYKDAIDALLSMQQIKAELPAYDTDKLMQEMSLFETWYLNKHLSITLDDTQKSALFHCMQSLIDNALEQPQVFVHRDYHSRNLMLTDTNNPGVIDYQDAVIGPVTYDLVSLFKDCYIEWPRTQIEQWLQHYMNKSYLNITFEQLLRWFDLMGVQRHLKVLGIFCRLYYRDGKSQYLDDLPLTRKYIMDTCSRYKELSPLTQLINGLEKL